jgi:hypothetical protein
LPSVGYPLVGTVVVNTEDTEVGSDVEGAITRVDADAVHMSKRRSRGSAGCLRRSGTVASSATGDDEYSHGQARYR